MPDINKPVSANSIQTNQGPSRQTYNKTDSGPPELTKTQQQKATLNISILKSAAAIIGVKDEPLSLVLSSVIDEMNKVLEPELGAKAIQKSVAMDSDASPQATAERIVSQSISYFGAYKARHEGEGESVILANFIQTVSAAIETGFSEARDILEGLEILEGDIANNINKTFDLVQEKLVAFENMIMGLNSSPASSSEPGV